MVNNSQLRQMKENLVIVESPAKAKTIEKFLGDDFSVTSSYGHVRDLAKKNFGIDIENNYKPEYIVSDDKKKVVSELKKMAKAAKMVWLASDEDREGEAIAWHLYEVLGLKPENTKRIVFNEITKPAILNAIENPREIDSNLVEAQQARRVLDRLVGFELSPILWKKVKPSLSAGRVQSVAVRLIVEREREIMNFNAESAFKVVGEFTFLDDSGISQVLKADLKKRLKTEEEVNEFLENCKSTKFSVVDVVKKPGKKSPAPPFTTSTLQQEASRKLGFSVSQTMSIAQKLYEAGKITYMRTDSVNLSDTALSAAQKTIIEEYGEEYYKQRKYKSKIKGAQEAHEAIRPTYLDKMTTGGTDQEKKLYSLIWKRTVASQMSDARLEKTTITISTGLDKLDFAATGEVLKFDGFLKLYIESTDDEEEQEDQGLLPKVSVGKELDMSQIEATERFTHHPPRYTEASLVKKLEELGIGRPSTYAPTISTVQNRGYIVKEDREGKKRNYKYVCLESNKIKNQQKTETTGAEKKKMFPSDIGIVVTDFLIEYFEEIMSYNFTAKVEQQFDNIATGGQEWTLMIDRFYKPFHVKVEDTLENSERKSGERILGEDPKTGKQVSVRIGRYGPLAQLGTNVDEEKPQFASLRTGQHLETITLEEALDLFKLPRTLGKYEDKVVVAAIGRFGPYIRHDSKFVSLKKDIDDPLTVELDRAIELIEEKREADRKKFIKAFEEDSELQILNGRWGPYIKYQKKNFKIPKTVEDPKTLTFEDCQKLIQEQDDKKKTSSKTTKKTSEKKTTTKRKTKKS